MTKDQVLAQVKASDIELVRFLYCDNGNIIRGKMAHRDSLAGFMESGIGLTVAMQGFCITEHLAAGTSLGPVGEIRLVPDPNTFSILPYAPDQARMMVDMMRLDKQPWELCPRSFLKRMIAQLANQGLEAVAAFEFEFYLARRKADGGFETFDDSLCFASAGMDSAGDIMVEVSRALYQQGIPLQQYYPELGPGQQEISVRHAPALVAADRNIAVRTTLHGVAIQHDLVVSLAPKPFLNQAGNGCHLHLSLWRDGQNVLYDPEDKLGLSSTGYHFINGILTHLPALLAVTCPSVNSYARLKPNMWSSAYTCYGPDNREAAVRIASPFWGREAESTNFELKSIDASANPYLALGAVIACGLDGLRRKKHPGEPVTVNPFRLSEKARAARGIKRFPETLDAALDHLEQDEVLLEALGEPLAKEFIAVRRSEWEDFKGLDPEQVALKHFHRY
ncbi:MAG: glutamine synthetase [Deinococcus sp.]|nr:glutamine synthetase [Deinococcus sp.]